MSRRLLAMLVLASVVVSSARASITPEAAVVVARWLEVTGGPATFAAQRTSYAHATVEAFGFTGTFESWTARPDRRYARTALGPFQLSEGTDGGRAWRTDPTTGVVRTLADHDLRDALESTWFELERWAEPDQGGGTVTLAGPERDATGALTVLLVAPPDLTGDGTPVVPRRLLFRDRDGQLVRSVERDDQREVVTEYRDHVRLAERVRPRVSETTLASMPANRMRATTDSMAVNLDVTAVPFAAAQTSAPDAVRWLMRDGVATLPFEYRARHVWVKARVNGGPLEDFLFDTGASVTVLDSAWVATRGLRTAGRMQAAGAGAAGGASFTTLDSLHVLGRDGDGVALAGVKVAVLDVNPPFEPLFWRRMAGVIGYDVIARFVVTVDYDRQVITLHDPATWRYTGSETPLPMVMNGTVPAVHAAFDGDDEGLFRLDVGSGSTVDVHSPFVRRHALQERIQHPLEVDGVGFGGTFASTLGRLRRMRIGPYEWDDPIVVLSGARDGAFASEEFAGNIGNGVLERFTVTFDYARRQVVLEPGARYDVRDHLTRAGILFTRLDGIVRVASVLPGSPGERAGLQPWDEVLRIENRPIESWDLPQVTATFDDGEAGRTVRLRVRRDRAERELRVRLADFIR